MVSGFAVQYPGHDVAGLDVVTTGATHPARRVAAGPGKATTQSLMDLIFLGDDTRVLSPHLRRPRADRSVCSCPAWIQDDAGDAQFWSQSNHRVGTRPTCSGAVIGGW